MEKKEKSAERSGYDSLPDEELIRKYRNGDTQVCDYLMEKYKRMVRTKARELYLVGGDRDDLLQEGMMGLFKAIREYDPEREASFQTYAGIVVANQIYSAILSAQRKKHMPLNFSIPISELEENQEESRLGLMESPENIVVGQEEADDLKQKIYHNLSSFEKLVLDLYLEGMDYQEIAEKLNRNPKSIDNALQRIRIKVNDIRAVRNLH